MPVYGTNTNSYIPVIEFGDSFLAINSEASSVYTSGTATERCAIGFPPTSGILNISVEVAFSANPGTFEIDFQDADTDSTTAYQAFATNPIAVTTASQAGGSGNYVGRAEGQFKGKFARLNVKTQTSNAVTIVYAKITM